MRLLYKPAFWLHQAPISAPPENPAIGKLLLFIDFQRQVRTRTTVEIHSFYENVADIRLSPQAKPQMFQHN